MSATDTLSDAIFKHGITVVILVVVLAAFLYGIYLLLKIAIPKLIGDLQQQAKEERERTEIIRREGSTASERMALLFTASLEKRDLLLVAQMDKSEQRDEKKTSMLILSFDRMSEKFESVIDRMEKCLSCKNYDPK